MLAPLLLSDKRFDVIETTRLIQDTKETIEKQNGYLNLYNPRSAFWQGKDLSERDFGNCFLTCIADLKADSGSVTVSHIPWRVLGGIFN